MSQKRLIIFIVVSWVIIGLVLGDLYLNFQMDQPLGPTLNGALSEQPLTNLTQFSSPDQISTPVQGSPQIQISQPRPYCGNQPVLYILIAGIDYRGDDYLYGLADSIRVVRIDFTTHEVSVLTLERDIWVEIPGISGNYGITHGKLNQAYFYGVPAMGYYDGPGGGAGLLAATLKLNFGLDVDNYMVVSFAAFTNGINALGGVDVYLPTGVNGDYGAPGSQYYQTLGYFPPGMNHLNGSRALDLARIRQGYTTIFRNQNEDQIFKGIYKKITSPALILKGPELVQILKDTVLTDLTPRQMTNIMCLVSKMNSSDVGFAAIPESNYVESMIYDPEIKDETYIWKIDFDFFRSYISKFMDGQVP